MIYNLKEQLLGAIHSNFAEKFAYLILDNPESFPELYALTFDENSKTAWRAMWVCEKVSYWFPEWFMDKRSELMQRIIQCTNHGSKRSLLNILLYLPIEEPISVEFLNFCLDHMLSPQEPIAIQALCMKMAYELCKKEPELLPEFQYILKNAEPEYYSKGIQTAIRNTLKQLKQHERTKARKRE